MACSRRAFGLTSKVSGALAVTRAWLRESTPLHTGSRLHRPGFLATILGVQLSILPVPVKGQTAPLPAPAASAAAPDPVVSLKQRAIEALQNKQYEAALAAAQAYLAARPDDGSVHLLRGTVLNQLMRHVEAVAAHSRAIELAPREPGPWTDRGWARLLAGEFDSARADCEQALKLDPLNWAARVNLGHTWLLQGEAARALEIYKDVIWRIDSEQDLKEGPLADFDIFIGRSWQRDSASQAKAWFERAWPQWQQVRHYTNENIRLSNAGRSGEALEPSRRAAELSADLLGAEHPQTGTRLNNLAETYRAMGRYEQALPLYQRALAIAEKSQGPDHPSTGTRLNNLAVLYHAMGRYEQALPLYQRALAVAEKSQGPEHPDTGTRLNNLAELYRAMGRYEQALPLYQRTLAIAEKSEGPEHPSTGTSLNNLAGLYRAMGRYEQVLPLYQRALAIAEKSQGPEHPDTGTRLNNLAELYRAMGRYEQALPLYQRALAIAEKSQGPEHPDTGTRLNNLAELYRAMGRYEQALPLYQRALAVAEKSQGPEHPDTGTRLNNLAELYRAMGRYEQALPLYQRALAIAEKSQGPEHPDTGTSLNNLAVLYHAMGRYEQALPLYQRALAVAEKSQGPEHPDTGTRLNNLAELYRAMGRYEQALPLYQRALALFEKSQGPEHPDTGTSLNNLAVLFESMGRYEQALPLYQRALAIAEKSQGPEHPDTGTRLNNLAELYRAMGRYEQALPLYQRALAIAEKSQGPEHPDTGTRLNNLAVLFESMGRYEQALPLYQRALAIAEKSQGPEHPDTGTRLNNLAGLFESMGRYEQALPLFQRALALFEKSQGPEHPDTGTSLNNLAYLYSAMGRYEQALPLYQRALAIAEKSQGPEHPDTGTRLNNLAGLFESMGRYEQALPLYQRALALFEKSHGPDHPSTGTSLNNLAQLYRDMGRYEQALPLYQRGFQIGARAGNPELSWNLQGNLMHLHGTRMDAAPALHQPALAIWYGKQAINTLQTVRSHMKGLDKELQGSFLKKNEGTYQQLANLLIETGRIAEAEQVLAMLKERELFELTRSSGAEQTATRVGMGGVERSLLEEQQRLDAQGVQEATELAALERKRKAEGGLGPADEARSQALLRSAEAWRASYQRFMSSLSERFAAAARQSERRDAEQQVTGLQRKVTLDAAGALGLHYVVTDDRIGIIVATQRGSFGRFSLVTKSALNQQIAALRQVIVAKGDTQPAAQALWRMLIEPVLPDIQATGAKTLVLSTTDTLRYLPFAALQNPAGRYLVEDYALGLWAAAADITPSSSSVPWQVAGLGLTQARPGFSALPAVRDELQGIVQGPGRTGVLPGSIALDEQFTRQKLESGLNGPTNVMHLASHFDFKPGDESRSVLLLGAGEPMSLGQLGALNFGDIEQLTLSACDTATGGGVNENGAEVEGLAAAVLKSGAKAVLATLWKVADSSTASLMRGFYAQRAQASPHSRAQALRAAQLALLRGEAGATGADAARGVTVPGAANSGQRALPVDPAKPWAHPYYWAPFVLSGNWL